MSDSGSQGQRVLTLSEVCTYAKGKRKWKEGREKKLSLTVQWIRIRTINNAMYKSVFRSGEVLSDFVLYMHYIQVGTCNVIHRYSEHWVIRN